MITYIICFLISITVSDTWSDNRQRRFKDEFLFGAASSAYQVEGAWDIDGKGESIWDRYVHEHPEAIVDGKNGDVASDSYHQYKRDVELLRELGVDYYRFSISWPRVLPTGFPNKINAKGIEYYQNFIDELLKYNIQPMITLYHFDLPQPLQDLGGWANPHSVQWFQSYAKVIFDNFANKVQYWITVNQPKSICMEGYGQDLMAPALNSRGIGDYMCVKNVLLAHASVYRLYEKEYKAKYGGLVGIALSINWAEPINNKTENVKARDEYREFNIGLYVHPIWSKDGDFPKLVKDIVGKKSKEQGFPTSRLPEFSAAEKSILKGSSDFLGMNHYTTVEVTRAKKQFPSPSLEDDVNVEVSQSKEWKQSKSTWLRSAPFGIYKACIYLNLNYDYPTIFITEHGWSSDVGLRDVDRVENIRGYLNALLYALEDGTELKGYTSWSLIDNVEWRAGISERFGLYEVDFDSEDKKRSARLSAHVYKRIIERRIVEKDWEPKSLKMKLSKRKTKKDRTEL